MEQSILDENLPSSDCLHPTFPVNIRFDIYLMLKSCTTLEIVVYMYTLIRSTYIICIQIETSHPEILEYT